jgi:delta8-fatty-acid desaturase
MYANVYSIISSAVILGITWQQLAFIGHDFGHMNTKRGVNKYVSLLATGLFGVSVNWWKHNHNVHHIITNSIEHDPDIQHLPFLCISQKIIKMKKYYSTYYDKMISFDTWSKFFVSGQHKTFYLDMALARINLYLQSSLFLSKNLCQNRYAEIIALSVFWLWYTCLVWQIESGLSKCLFIVVSHVVAGIVHIQITLSHFSMKVFEDSQCTEKNYPDYEIIDKIADDLVGKNSTNSNKFLRHLIEAVCVETLYNDSDSEDEKDDMEDNFITRQFKTTLNIRCPRYMDWFHGGLQLQLEHHLFPHVSRSRLRELSEKFVIPFAVKYKLPYYSVTFIEANRLVCARLKEVADYT